MAGDFTVDNDGQCSFVPPDPVPRERPPLIDPIDVPLWTRNKWRLFLDVDLPTASLLEAVAFNWALIWNEQSWQSEADPRQQPRRRNVPMLESMAALERIGRQLERALLTPLLDLPEDAPDPTYLALRDFFKGNA